jgi:ribose 5-phosphate isomerase A
LGNNWTAGVPIEVLPMAHRIVKESIEKQLRGEAVLRQAKFKAGPVVTDNGNFIIDWKFESSQLLFDKTNNNIDWKQINIELKSIPGECPPVCSVSFVSYMYSLLSRSH